MADTRPTQDGRQTDGRVRRSYDAVAAEYFAHLGDELDRKPFDRALLAVTAELCVGGRLADVGCGPGHVTKFLAGLHPDVIGIDLSPEMIRIARRAFPDLRFEEASMLNLPVADGAWAGAVALYSVIHFSPAEATAALVELARVVAPGGWLLLAFHVDSADFPTGSTNHLTEWFGQAVDLDGHFLDDRHVAAEADAAGWTVEVSTLRNPMTDSEYPSRRCYLLARRHRE